jgi:hypothetical protein
MSSSGPIPAIPLTAIVDLARTRDGMLRWLRLRALWDTLLANDAVNDSDALADLQGQLDAALSDAEAHAVRLAAFYDAHADAVNALLADPPRYLEDGRVMDRLRAAGPDFAAAAAERARTFAELSSSERESIGRQTAMPQSDSPRAVFCAALATMQEESDVACISTGDPLECAFGGLVAELTDQYC